MAITLLVFNISVSPTTQHLPEDLGRIWPEYLSYGMSFMFIGIIWAQHHSIFTLIKRTDHVFLLINIVFLMWVSFLPFPTHVLGEQLGKHNEQAAMSVYAGWFLIGTVPFNALWWYAAGRHRLLSDGANPHLVRVTSRSYLLGPVFYGTDFALSFVSVVASLALFLALAAFYAVAPIPAIGRTALFRPFTGLEARSKG